MLKKIRVSLIVLFTSILLLQSQAYADSLDDGQLLSEETFIILKDDKNVEKYTKKLKENDNGQIEKLAKSITTNTEKNNNTHNSGIIDNNSLEPLAVDGVATMACSYKKSTDDIVCNWTGTLFSDFINYSYMKVDWYINDGWFYVDNFKYPVNGATNSISNQAIMDVGGFKGTYSAHLNGSVQGRYGTYTLSSWSKKVYIP